MSDLFNVRGSKSLDSNAVSFVDSGVNFVGRSSENNGVQGKIKKQNFEPNSKSTITATVVGNYKYVKYQTSEYYCSQNINVLTPKEIFTQWDQKIAKYFVTILDKFVSTYNGKQGGYKLEDINNHLIKIPFNGNEINYSFINNFISFLEKEREDKIIGYIEKNKFYSKDFSMVESDILCLYNQVIFKEFKIEDLFYKIKVKSLKYKTSELPQRPFNEYDLPALTAGIQNQGLNSYVPREGADILKNVISISANGANTGATFYQKEEFTVLQDSYAIKWSNENENISDNQYLFLTTVISKAILGNYEWTNKASWERIKSTKISLPIKNNKIDFEFMELFIENIKCLYTNKLRKRFL